jgi:hypothetical protein
MYATSEVRNALFRGKLKRAAVLLEQASSLSAPEITTLVRDVIQSGCLILKHRGAEGEKNRDAVLLAVLQCLKSSDDPSALIPLAKHLAHSQLLELAYSAILETLGRSAISRCPPAQQAWAAIRFAAETVKVAIEKVQEKIQSADRTTLQTPSTIISEPGAPYADVDGVVAGVASVVWATLHMLAYREGWFNEDRLVLPPPTLVDDDLVYKSGSNSYLADTWLTLETADEHLRYFGDEDGQPQGRSTLKFEFSLTSKWYEDVARERLNQLALGYHLKIFATDLSGLIETHAPALAPIQFLSRDELLGYSVLRDAYHLDVDNTSERYGLLSIREWLRGYAVLKEMCQPDSPSPKLDILHFHRADLLASLQSAGLSNDSAEVFIDAATLSRGKRDLFDVPLIVDTEGDLHLMTPVLFSAALPLIVESQIGNSGDQPEKGATFENAVRELFCSHGVPAKRVQYRHEGTEYECDALVLWGEHLFVIECKNHILPSAHASHRFTFWENVRSDVAQCKRIATQISMREDLITDAFGTAARVSSVHPVLLNSMPFSVPGGIEGVYVYDYSALSRFFREPFITFSSPVVRKDGSTALAVHRLGCLWAADRPSPGDLLREMGQPVQLAGNEGKWFEERVKRALSQTLAIDVPFLVKDDIDFRDVLRARGHSEESIAQFERTALETLESLRTGRPFGEFE